MEKITTIRSDVEEPESIIVSGRERVALVIGSCFVTTTIALAIALLVRWIV